MAGFKVLLFEAIHKKGMAHLEEHGAQIAHAPGFEPNQICSSVGDVDGIIARAQGRIDANVMDHAPRLKVVGRHGIGVDNIDVAAATERGIFVVNTPDAPGESVAEFVAMALVALSKGMVHADRAVRNDDWDFRNRHVGPELIGKAMGIVGMGRIGRRIAEICSLGFGMNVVYHDVYPLPAEEEKRLKVRSVDLKQLLSTSDFVSLNVPLLESTRHLIDADTINLMQPHAYLVNCSRGPVVDEKALLEALECGRIAGAAIDVFEQEPVSPDNPLLKLDNVLLSPHCSGHSVESAEKMSMVTADIVRILAGQKPAYPVNDPPSPRQKVT